MAKLKTPKLKVGVPPATNRTRSKRQTRKTMRLMPNSRSRTTDSSSHDGLRDRQSRTRRNGPVVYQTPRVFFWIGPFHSRQPGPKG